VGGNVSTAALTCQELVELVSDYVEGALGPQDARRFERHVDGCSGCAAYLAQLRETIRLTGTLAEDEFDPRTPDVLLAAFRDWHRGRG
jgi:anti-sigma factor RsiW